MAAVLCLAAGLAGADPWGTPATAPAKSTSAKWFDAKAPVGVWVGTESGMKYVGGQVQYAAGVKIATVVVLPGGRMIRGAPWAGLDGFDYAAWEQGLARDPSLGGTPGTYTWSGARGKVTYPGGHTADLKLEGDMLVLAKAKLYRATDVTGARLDGSYTYFSDPEDAYFDGPGCKQIVTFKPDGTFDDRGGFATNCLAPTSDAARAPGRGTYELRDFSLVLRYADGRTTRHLITAPIRGDLKKDTKHLVINGQLWSRRSRPPGGAAPPAAPLPPSTTPATGNTMTFDIVTFTPPPGEVSRTSSSIGFTTIDQRAGSYCLLGLFASVASTGSAAGDFAAEWKDIVLNGRTAAASPATAAGSTPGGLSFLAGGSQTKGKDGKSSYYALFVFTVGGKRFSVTLTAPDESKLGACHASAEAFLKSLRV